MAHIIPLPAIEHREVHLLLPWYASGRLDETDHARVEAHLGGCAECQADLAFERRLGAEMADLPAPVEADWMRLRRRLDARPWPTSAGDRLRSWLPAWRLPAGGGWLGWTLAAQLVLLVLMGMQVVLWQKPGGYHVLGDPPLEVSANIVMNVRPDLAEKDFRDLLNAAHARVVDGPTVTDAWMLRAPPSERDAALGQLRARPEVILAEPLDPGGQR